eukprot:GDKH01004183.1.p1 GENE.GDKH01004183.1~~GDKH01004183.1.p1  ORF type:complete len:166 (-),score=11.52 GDKH01004183.1:236-733(-)
MLPRAAGEPLRRVSSRVACHISSEFNTRLCCIEPCRGIATSVPLRRMETWEEVEAHRPRVPKLDPKLRPSNAPSPEEITRKQFRQFMRGKMKTVSTETKQTLALIALLTFIICEVAFTIKQLSPDDFQWVEEERTRIEAAKRKMARILQKQQEEEAAANRTVAKD